MEKDNKQIFGTIGWIDLTTPNAEVVKDFYAEVVGCGNQSLYRWKDITIIT